LRVANSLILMILKKSCMYKIRITPIAAEALKRLDQKTQTKIIHWIEELKKDPEQFGKQLKGPLKELRSIRAAEQRYRIIYKILETEIMVIIVALGLRKDGDKKDIYELMKKYIRTGLIEK